MSIRIRVTEQEAERLEKINPNKSLALQMLFLEYDDTKRRNKLLQEITNEMEEIKEYMIRQDEMIAQILSILTRVYGIKI